MVFKAMVSKLSPTLLSLCAGLIFSAGAHAQVVPLDRVAAIVDNDVVMTSQLNQRLDDLRRQLAERGTQLPPDEVLREQVLDRLVVESIQLQMGERAGIRIDDAALNQTMQQLAQRNNVTPEEFRAALERDGISYNQAREQIRREMIINRVRQRRVAERIQVSDQEVRNFLNSEMGRIETATEYRLAMIVLPISETASASEVSEIAETLPSPARVVIPHWKVASSAGAAAPSCLVRLPALSPHWTSMVSLSRCAHLPAFTFSSCWKPVAATVRWWKNSTSAIS